MGEVIYAGFDMVPKLSESSIRESELWSQFIGDVEAKYRDDPSFAQQLLTLEFSPPPGVKGPTAKLPLQGQKFLRFCVGYKSQDKSKKRVRAQVSLAKELCLLAQKYFGARVKYWDEGEGELGHYSWAEVEAMFSMYSSFTRGTPKDNLARQMGFSPLAEEGGWGYEAGETIQTPVEPFFKVLFRGERNRRCSNCLEKLLLNFVKCKNCPYVKYCTKECRKKDWDNGHCLECTCKAYHDAVDSLLLLEKEKQTMTMLDLGPGNGFEEVKMRLQLIRLISFLQANPDKLLELFQIYNGSYKSFQDVIDKVNNEVDNEVVRKLAFSKYCSLVRMEICVDNETFKDVDEAMMLLFMGILENDVVPIFNEQGKTVIAHGLYIQTCFFKKVNTNNSKFTKPKPTAKIVRSGALLSVKAITHIPRGVTPSISI